MKETQMTATVGSVTVGDGAGPWTTLTNIAPSFPTYAGHWIIPGAGVHFSTLHRPNWFHRLMNRALLGWKWEAN